MEKAVAHPACAVEVLEPRLLMANFVFPTTISYPPPAIPMLSTWEASMATLGHQYSDPAVVATWDLPDFSGPNVPDEGLAWYYDGERVALQTMDYTGDAYWYGNAQAIEAKYRPHALTMWNPGRPGGWQQFAKGLGMDYLKTNDVLSRTAVETLRTYNPGAYGSYSCAGSRETAYAINNSVVAYTIGSTTASNLSTLVNYALGHLDQWFISKTESYMQPFMAGLTFEALIGYYMNVNPDPRIPTTIKASTDWLWNNAYSPTYKGFYYDTKSPTSHSTSQVLNLLIAPAYAWLWRFYGDSKYQVEGDALFQGAMSSLNQVYGGKQFSQLYRWSFDYVQWRSDVANPADHTAPVISEVSDVTLDPTNNSGTIRDNRFVTWRTNEPSDSVVEYGPTTSYGRETTLNSYKINKHIQILNNLVPGQQYHYRIKTTDSSGNVSYSADRVFTAVDNSDVTPPSITNANSSSTHVRGNVTVTATATDNMGVAGIKASLGEYKLGEVFTSPYSITYDTSSMPDGTYYLSVTAYDLSGRPSDPYGIGEIVVFNSLHGDMNGDGLMNGQDIFGFIQALGTPSAYNQANPTRKANLSGDMNGDDVCNGQDIFGFLQALKAGVAPPEVDRVL